jgi:endonuclease/exonuclease/phosphatase family metal-dependent hydrolase
MLMGRLRTRFGFFLFVLVAVATVGPLTWMAASKTSPYSEAPLQGHGLTVTIASLNIAKVTDVARIGSEIEANPYLREADVLLLQEVVRASEKHPSVAELLANRLQRNVVFASPDGNTTFSGLAILTPGPLRETRVRPLKSNNLVFRTRTRVALAATADTVLGPMRVVNAHLDTRVNPTARVEQLGPAIEEAVSFSGPGVIGGDLNTNDMQWISNVVPLPWPGWQASKVRELMTSKGFETPFQTRRATFDHLGMQLDWIFANKLAPVRHGIEPMEFSDHHAIWVQFSSR